MAVENESALGDDPEDSTGSFQLEIECCDDEVHSRCMMSAMLVLTI